MFFHIFTNHGQFLSSKHCLHRVCDAVPFTAFMVLCAEHTTKTQLLNIRRITLVCYLGILGKLNRIMGFWIQFPHTEQYF